MGQLGVHFALDEHEVGGLMALPNQDARANAVREDIEPRLIGTDLAVETEKAWDAIHRCFDNGRLTWTGGEYPMNHAILGGRQLTDGRDYIISLKSPQQVRDIAAKIATVTEQELRARYRTIASDYGHPLDAEDEAYTWEIFQLLAPFYARAAQAGLAVIFTADQ